MPRTTDRRSGAMAFITVAIVEAVDERTDEEKAKKQVPGVTPPTKRE